MSRTVLAFALYAATSSVALAAATAEQAAQIKTTLQAYFGATPGVVEVAPEGDGYKLTLDFGPLAAGAKNAKVTMTPLAMTLADQGGGKWQVDSDQPVSFGVDAGDQGTLKYDFGGFKMTGVFDEALGTFATQDVEVTNLHYAQNLKDPKGAVISADYTVEKMTSAMTATAAGEGADMVVKQSFTGMNETIAIPADPKLSTQPVPLTITAPSGTADMTIKNAKTNPINQLLAWFVAHPSKELMVKDQGELKQRATAALPLWERAEATGSLDGMTVQSPVGPFSADKLTFEFGFSGMVADASLREKFAMTGIKSPPGLVPAWAEGLAPKEAAFAFAISDLNLDLPARLFLDHMDLSQDKPISDDISNQMLTALMPKGHATLTLEPNNIVAPLYTLGYQMVITMAPSKVQGNALITMKGLDDVMAALAAAPPESGAQAGVGGLMAAKGMGKAESDGSISWKIESAPDGGVLVNGIDVRKMMAAPAPQQ